MITLMNEIRERLPHPKTRIEIIYAGGTISALATPQGYREGGHVVDLISRLEERQPGFIQRFDLGQPQVTYTGLSENIGESDLVWMENAIDTALANNPDSILMSFGTDFAEQAAKRFQNKYRDQLKQQGVKIIIVTANDDLSHPNTDAWDNLTFSLESAAGDAEPGVYLGFHGRLVPADSVVKEPYNGKEMNFRSIDDPEYIEGVRKQREQTEGLIDRLQAKVAGSPEAAQSVLDYPVNIFRLNHQELLGICLKDGTIRAILLTLYHSGTANATDSEASVSRLVNHLRGTGIVFFGVTENGEPVDLHSYETSVKLRSSGVVPLYDMFKEVALAKLRLANSYLTANQLIEDMLRNRVGEIDETTIIPEDINKLRELYK